MIGVRCSGTAGHDGAHSGQLSPEKPSLRWTGDAPSSPVESGVVTGPVEGTDTGYDSSSRELAGDPARGAVEAERAQDQGEPCDTALPTNAGRLDLRAVRRDITRANDPAVQGEGRRVIESRVRYAASALVEEVSHLRMALDEARRERDYARLDAEAAADAVDPLRAGPGEGQDDLLPPGGEGIQAASDAHMKAVTEGRSGHVAMMAALRAVAPIIAARVRAEAVAEEAQLDAVDDGDLAELRRWANQTPDRFARDAVLTAADAVERAQRMAAKAIADERRRIAAKITARKIAKTTDFPLVRDKRWWGAFEHGLDCALADVAAGSVPAATPGEHRNVDGFCPACDVYWPCDPSVATNFAPSATTPATCQHAQWGCRNAYEPAAEQDGQR